MADPLKSRILEDVKDAMRARDRARLGTLRMVTAAIKQQEVDQRTASLDDSAVVAVLEKMLKQRRESVRQYESAGREDLASGEREEIAVIEQYMPQALGAAEIDAIIEAIIEDTGAATMKDMGRVMGLLKPRVQGRADMGAVSASVRARLSG
ncbi:MAG: GatB/YqeY domain-containing protein [Thiotrichales bacterium]|nr:GatB/YqeY domain-containing protein [Thiotrichales bacterium]MCY4285245.1 GatB/YqeY domain-containing protein [Thiotrichales bacterium]MCY4349623.1 GatB/YqeY domain-containing protein [Thiotrichales bacterium]